MSRCPEHMLRPQTRKLPFLLVGDGETLTTPSAPEGGQRDFCSGTKAGFIDVLSQQQTHLFRDCPSQTDQ